MRRLAVPFLAGLFLLTIVPLLFILVQSFAGHWPFPRVLPEMWNVRWWTRLSAPGIHIAGIFSSLSYSLAVTGVSLVLVLFPARELAWGNVSGAKVWEALFLAPVIVPPLATVFGIHRVLSILHATDNVAAVVAVLTFYASPYLFRSLTAGYRILDRRLTETARHMNAGFFRTLITVELPLLAPFLASGCAIVFLVAFSDFLVVSLIGGGIVPSISGVIVPALTSSNRAWASVLVLIFTAIPLVALAATETLIHRQRKTWGIQ